MFQSPEGRISLLLNRPIINSHIRFLGPEIHLCWQSAFHPPKTMSWFYLPPHPRNITTFQYLPKRYNFTTASWDPAWGDKGGESECLQVRKVELVQELFSFEGTRQSDDKSNPGLTPSQFPRQLPALSCIDLRSFYHPTSTTLHHCIPPQALVLAHICKLWVHTISAHRWYVR